MIPRRPLFATGAILLALGLLQAVFAWPAAAWWAVAGIAGAMAAIDAALAWNAPVPEIERHTPGSMSLLSEVGIRVTVRNPGERRELNVLLFDHHPQSFEVEGLPLAVRVPPGRFADLDYRARPTRRGAYSFKGSSLRIASPLGLWWRKRFVENTAEVRVYPNYSTISKLLAYEVDNRLQLAGVRLSRRRGEGIEFHQLRDYRDGDSLRSIDWKATSRMSRLIAREYQDERDQQIVFLLDTGRRMLAKDGDLSHFDHALNAMLLLSYVALRQGDGAGVMTAGPTRSWLPPRKGLDAINDLLNHVYEIEPQHVEVDYLAAATELAVRQRRRSLVVILTNVREEDSEDLRAATGLLRRKHLVILASLREAVLDETLAKPIHGFDEALVYASTSQFMEARREAQSLLRARGVFVEDCLCDDLPAAITSRYMAIKRSGLL